MKISNIEIRMCRHAQSLMKDTEMRDGKKSDLEFLVSDVLSSLLLATLSDDVLSSVCSEAGLEVLPFFP